ncbi:MAG: META domain-containing protein [Vicinamibacterales bacterium]
MLTRGYGNTVTVMLRRAGAGQATPAPQSPSLSLDPLPATFAGLLPCADCPGIWYQLNVFADGVFFLRMTYQDRNVAVDEVGRWLLSSDGRILLLKGGRDAPVMLAIEDRDTLRLLSPEGEAIPSTLNYELQRSIRVEPLEPRLNLDGMYGYVADAGVFTECLTGRRLAVAQERDNAALETAYIQARRQAGEEMKVLVDARLVVRPNPDTAAGQPALVVEQFISLTPGDTCGVPFAAVPLETTYWRAMQLGGKPVPAADASREAHLVFEPGGRVAGSDGCNRVAGSYELNGDAITFGQMAPTRMACPDTSETERAFHDVLTRASRWRILGDRLELFDAAGTRLARFEPAAGR